MNSQTHNGVYKSALGAAGNTHNPSLIVLRDKGYHLWVEGDERDGLVWFAAKDGHKFGASTGPELLGLVALYDHFGDGWNRQSPNILEELIDAMPD